MKKKTDETFISSFYETERQQIYESVRLEKLSPSEFAMTKIFITEFFPEDPQLTNSKREFEVLDIGCGYGHYSEFICSTFQNLKININLVDITSSFIKNAKNRLEKNGHKENIKTEKVISVLDLKDNYEKNSMDFVLCLGPLYHLQTKEERKKAIKNCMYVLKPNGIVFFAGINRLSPLRTSLLLTANTTDYMINKNLDSYVETGIFNKDLEMPLCCGYTHLFTEFNKEIEDNCWIDRLKLIGTQAFSQNEHNAWNKLSLLNKSIFLKHIYQVCELPEGLGRSDHFLFIGRKRKTKKSIISKEDKILQLKKQIEAQYKEQYKEYQKDISLRNHAEMESIKTQLEFAKKEIMSLRSQKKLIEMESNDLKNKEDSKKPSAYEMKEEVLCKIEKVELSDSDDEFFD